MQVYPITDAGTATPTLGTVIPVGSHLQAIAADSSKNVWLAGTSIGETTETNNVFVITSGNTVKTVTGLTYAIDATTLGGAPR